VDEAAKLIGQNEKKIKRISNLNLKLRGISRKKNSRKRNKSKKMHALLSRFLMFDLRLVSTCDNLQNQVCPLNRESNQVITC
jgi:hypothetical protein